MASSRARRGWVWCETKGQHCRWWLVVVSSPKYSWRCNVSRGWSVWSSLFLCNVRECFHEKDMHILDDLFAIWGIPTWLYQSMAPDSYLKEGSLVQIIVRLRVTRHRKVTPSFCFSIWGGTSFPPYITTTQTNWESVVRLSSRERLFSKRETVWYFLFCWEMLERKVDEYGGHDVYCRWE